MAKFLLDQTVGAAVNTVLFVTIIGGLRGASAAEAIQLVKQDFWPLMIAGLKLWPFVSILQFTVRLDLLGWLNHGQRIAGIARLSCHYG